MIGRKSERHLVCPLAIPPDVSTSSERVVPQAFQSCYSVRYILRNPFLPQDG